MAVSKKIWTSNTVVGMFAVMVFGGITYSLGNKFIDQLAGGGVAPTPAPVVESWDKLLADELRAEGNPARVAQLRNLWFGLAEYVPPEATTVVAVERMNKLAGSIAVRGLGPRNESASKICADAFRAEVVDKISDPLDDKERELVRVYFNTLAEVAEAAL